MSKLKETLSTLFKDLNINTPDISFKVIFWDGTTDNYGSMSPQFTLHLKTENAAARILRSGSLGFAEEYVNGNILVEGDITLLIRLCNDPHLKLSLRTKLLIFFYYLKTLNTLDNSKKNISHHYDLGNDFFKLWLDKTMAYTCAYYKKDSDTLEQAQLQKYEHICRKLQLKKGDTLIDLGCGWGEFLIYAAREFGINGMGISINEQQAEYARGRSRQEGVEDKAHFVLEDYRNVTGQYDKVSTIGMTEHIGKNYLPLFIKKIKSLLKPEGFGLLHTIGNIVAKPPDPWLVKYIFPGVYIPALNEVAYLMGKEGLVITDVENLRFHYPITLDEWSRRFEQNIEKIKNMFDERFIRMWYLYLKGTSGSLRYGNYQLYQMTFTKGSNNSIPLTREHLYC
ncbi:MAG: cyclopropane-fatty-acyl-phospholipid synthase [Elusimicrobia bacterium]|nr:cyclopropane-fatty-acyl-phospholipid synthase [Elusimicrobiota bacterium]